MERKLPEGWRWTKIGDIARVLGGKRLPLGHEYSDTNNNHPYIRVTDFEDMTISLKDLKFLKPETQELICKYTISKKDLYISIAGSIGKVGIIPEELDGANLTENAAKITDLKSFDRRFLCYALNSKLAQQQIAQKIISANQPKLALFRIEQIIVPQPPIETQRRIVAVLDKAEETRRLRAQADELARRLIQSVFLDMFGDPVRNPNRWETEKLKAISEKFSDGPFGSNLRTEHYTDEGIRVVRLQNIGVSRFINDDRAYVSEEHFSILQKHACIPGDVLIGTMGDPNLRACILPNSINLAINKADCVQCRPDKNRVLPEYICHLLNLPSLLRAASNLVHGETRGRISSGQLANLLIPIPPLSLQERFSRIVESAEQIISKQNQSQNEIITIFDLLLQKAFTGELAA